MNTNHYWHVWRRMPPRMRVSQTRNSREWFSSSFFWLSNMLELLKSWSRKQERSLSGAQHSPWSDTPWTKACRIWQNRSKDLNHELRQFGTTSTIFGDSLTALRHSQEHEGWGFDVFAKEKGGWPIAQSIRNIMLILVAVSKPCKILQTELPENLHEKKSLSCIFFDFL